jgi:hypothetical protein
MVVLHTTPSFFDNFAAHPYLEVAIMLWRFERRAPLYLFVEGQTHFGMPRGAKMSLALNEQK